MNLIRTRKPRGETRSLAVRTESAEHRLRLQSMVVTPVHVLPLMTYHQTIGQIIILSACIMPASQAGAQLLSFLTALKTSFPVHRCRSSCCAASMVLPMFLLL